MKGKRTRPSESSPAIWWIRRDLRLHDNRALHAAIERGKSVIPLFISDPYLLESRHHASARGRKAFLFAGLRSLDASLRARGSRLTVREGNPHQVLTQVLGETGANVIVAEENFSPYGIRRDGDVRKDLPLLLVPGASLRHPSDVVKRDGKPYTVSPHSVAPGRRCPFRLEMICCLRRRK
jgi:deoxyribodipyrimidine photo-lyase